MNQKNITIDQKSSYIIKRDPFPSSNRKYKNITSITKKRVSIRVIRAPRRREKKLDYTDPRPPVVVETRSNVPAVRCAWNTTEFFCRTLWPNLFCYTLWPENVEMFLVYVGLSYRATDN